jgi:NitT/TauT family transport system substrate-binding protein
VPHRPGSLVTVAVVLLAALAGTACAPGDQQASDGGEPEQVAIVVGTLPIVDVAPIHLALEEGYFADEGLDVRVEVVQGGAAAVPALIGGDLDIAYGAWPSFLIANARGFDLRAVADGTRARPGFTELLALPTSGLEANPEGLGGRRIAVNTLGNIGELAVRAALVRAGLAADAAELVEIPFPDMTVALRRGDVDVIWASEPVATLARDTLDAVLVTDSYVGEMEAFPVAGYQATAEFVEANPRTVAAFQRALARAVDRITADPELVVALAPSYTGLPAELAERVSMPEFRARLEATDLERVQDRLLAFGLLDAPLEVDRLLVDGP